MQITLVSSGDTVSDVLNRVATLFCVNESELNSFTDSQYLALRSSIYELKEIVDFLLDKFAVDLPAPKRNSRISLAGWIAQVLLSAREAAESSEAIADQLVDSFTVQCDSTMVSYSLDNKTKKYRVQDDICQVVTNRKYYDAWPDKMATGEYAVASLKSGGRFRPCAPGVGAVSTDFFFCCNPKGWQWEVWHYKSFASDQTANSPTPEIEVLEPEEKPVYTISIHPDQLIDKKGWGFTQERVSALPPYLLDRQDNLFEKSSYTAPSCDANYVPITSKQLSNIAEKYGQPIALITDDLVVTEAHVHGSPPPFIVNAGGVYKRMTWGVISWGKVVKYSQVISEYLSNIAVV